MVNVIPPPQKKRNNKEVSTVTDFPLLPPPLPPFSLSLSLAGASSPFSRPPQQQNKLTNKEEGGRREIKAE